MTKNTASKINETDFSVSIVDSKLILSLPNAVMPVVWQSNLEKAQSCSFTIQEDKKAKTFALILKAQDGSIDEIAHFSEKQISVDILMEISSVLQNVTSSVSSNVSNNNAHDNSPQNSPKKESNDNKAGAIISLALIAVLLLIWFISASNNINTRDGDSGFRGAETSSNTQGSSGVAMSADDFLSNR